MRRQVPSYNGFPPEIISHAVWLYRRCFRGNMGRANQRSGCCHRGPHGESSCSQHSMMHRSQPVSTHSKQILNDAVNMQKALGVVE